MSQPPLLSLGATAPADSVEPSAQPWLHRGTLALWLAVLVLGVPVFVCMPLTSDVVLYDLQARTVHAGGVAYRDIFETNLPGMIWVHMLVRPLIGDSSIAMRIADLTVVALITMLLLGIVQLVGARRAGVPLCLAISLCYLSTNEWCHAQRDTWMLLPSLLALWLRLSRLLELRRPRWLVHPVVEGLLWGLAFWLKPFTAIPGLACIVVSWSVFRLPRRLILRDAGAVVVGGLLAATAGIAWLIQTGAWPWFLQTMLEWNPEYVAAGKSRWTLTRLSMMLQRFEPWMWLHAVAVPVSLLSIRTARQSSSGADRVRAILSGFYLGWLLQSFAMQHLMDYIHVPALLLALAVLAGTRWAVPAAGQRAIVIAFLLVAAVASPVFRPQRLTAWAECVRRGSTPEMRMRLTSVSMPDFVAMREIIRFLRQQNLADHDVTCFNVHSIHIYDELRLRPSTRYLSLSSLLGLFPKHAEEILETVAGSGHRFVVTELHESRMSPGIPQPTPEARKTDSGVFPWAYPVVFRAGSYEVHQVPPATVAAAATRPAQ